MSLNAIEGLKEKMNEMGINDVAKGTRFAINFLDDYDKQTLKYKQDRSKVTMQPEPIDTRLLREEIQEAVENAYRPEVGQVPKTEHHIVQPRNPNLEIGREYTISDVQKYVNNKGREISYNNDRTQQPKEQVKIEEQNNYVVRSTKQEQSERNANRVQVNENERG